MRIGARTVATAGPHDIARTLRFHAAHAVPGVETWDGATFRRTLRLPGGPARISLAAARSDRAGRRPAVRVTVETPASDDVRTAGRTARAGNAGVLTAAVARARRLLDADADPLTIDAVLRRDPVLADLVARRPGLRSPGAADGPELAVRTIVGQQVSVAGARTVLGRITAAHGERAFDDEPSMLFPSPARLAALAPEDLPIPRARGRALIAMATALDAGAIVLEPGADPGATRASLLALPGVGPWTADYLLMRALGDTDILLAGDLAVRRVAADIDLDLTDTARVASWSPWGSYVSHHLWAVVLAQLRLP